MLVGRNCTTALWTEQFEPTGFRSEKDERRYFASPAQTICIVSNKNDRIPWIKQPPMDEIQKSEKCVKSVGAYANAYAF